MRKTCSHLKGRSVRNCQLLVMLLLLACGLNWYMTASRANEPCGAWIHHGWTSGTVTWTTDNNNYPQATISNATEHCGWEDPCEGTTDDDKNTSVGYTLVTDEVVSDGQGGYNRQYTWQANPGCENGLPDVVTSSHPLPRVWDTDTAIDGGDVIEPMDNVVAVGTEVYCELSEATDRDRWTMGPASGYENDTISYLWSANGGSFVGGITSRITTWKAPQEPGTYTLTCKINDGGVTPPGDYGSRDDDQKLKTIIVHVVKAETLQYRFSSADEFQNVPSPLYVPLNQAVEFKAIKNSGAPRWPTGKPVWGGTAGATGTGETKSVTFSTLSTTSTDYKTVTVECGNTLTANIVVVTVGKLQYRIDQPGTEDDEGPMTDVPADPETNPIVVPKGTTIIYKAIIAPTGAEWPSGKPVWAGTAGSAVDASTRSVIYNSASTTTTDYKWITVECGNNPPIKANVLVWTAELKVKRSGTVSTEYAMSAVVAAGAKNSNEHKADVRVKLLPAISGITIPTPTIIGGESVVQNPYGDAQITAVSSITDGNGEATFILTSSDKIKEISVEFSMAGVISTATISQRWHEDAAGMPWDYDPYYFYDEGLAIKYQPKFKAGSTIVDITSHTLNFMVSKADVWKWNESDLKYDMVNYPANSSGIIVAQLSGTPTTLAAFNPAQTGDIPSGQYNSELTVSWKSDEIADTVWFKVQDNDTYK